MLPSRHRHQFTADDVVILGMRFHSSDGDEIDSFMTKVKQYLETMYRMTYRFDFVPFRDSLLQSDVGWGCMLRTMQMLLAEALKRTSTSFFNERDIHSLFGDLKQCPLSLHQMLCYTSKPSGSWFGPAEAAYMSKQCSDSYPDASFKVIVADSGRIQKSEWDRSKEQDSALLLLFPLMLGTSRLNPTYHAFVLECLASHLCVGIAGGRPGSSYFFVGFQQDKVLYIDPHVVHAAINTLYPTEEQLQSYKVSTVCSMDLKDMNACMCLGFLCRDQVEMEQLCIFFSSIDENARGILHIAQSTLYNTTTTECDDFVVL